MPFHCSKLWNWNTFIFCCHSVLSLSLQPVCVCVCASQLEKPGDSSTRSTRSIETNAISKAYDPYFCKITMTQRERIGLVTVGHIPRELLRSVYLPKVVLLQVLLLVSVSSVTYARRRLEIPIQMTFSHTSKPIVERMKVFVESYLVKMDQVFRLDDDEENPDDDETKDIILDDDGDKELIQGGGNSGEAGTSTGPVVIVIDDEQQIVSENEEEIRESLRREINNH